MHTGSNEEDILSGVSLYHWRRQIAALGGVSPLLHYGDGEYSGIELSKAHPSGLPQFIVGKTVLLSNLIRDEVALKNARISAAGLVAKGNELLNSRGIHSIQLAIGLAKWQFEGIDYCAPLLLRPMAMRRYKDDFQLKLRGAPMLNHDLAQALRQQFGVTLEPENFVLMDSDTFTPQPVIERLQALTEQIEGFSVTSRLLVSCFASVSAAMLEDLQQIKPQAIIGALARDDRALAQLRQAYTAPPSAPPDERNPSIDTLLLPANPQQEAVIAHIAAGNSLTVKAVPGAGTTQVVVNALGELAAQNKRVLVVCSRQATLSALAHRLRQIGLGGLAVMSDSLKKDLVAAILRNENARPLRMTEVDDALVRLRRVLLDYRAALQQPDPQLGISPMQALDSLAALALMSNPPAAGVRLERAALEQMAAGREEVADLLRKAAELGEFEYGPGDSPWYGVSFSTNEEAVYAHEVAKRLSGTELALLLDKARIMVEQTRMRPFETLRELSTYLELLHGVRDVLEVFQPQIFDRSLAELIEATSSRRNSPDLPGAQRRQLKKLVKEYLRPGVRVSDIHEQLVRIQQLRLVWHRYVPVGVAPEVPVGIADVQLLLDKTLEGVSHLNQLLEDSELLDMPLPDLLRTLQELAVESQAMKNIRERTAIRDRLRELGLDPLLRDLSNRHVSSQQVSAELELAWLQSALDWFLKNRSALLGGNTTVLSRLEEDFKLVDHAHTAASSVLLAWNLAESWKVGLVDWPEEASRLKELLLNDTVGPKQVLAAAPQLSRVLAPIWLSSPYLVHQLPRDFDTVIFLDAADITVAEAVGAIARGQQIVAFGDPVTQNPASFSIGGTLAGVLQNSALSGSFAPATPPAEVTKLHGESLLAQLANILPVMELNRSYRACGEDIVELLNRHFYAGRIEALPWAGTYLGKRSVLFHHVPEGVGLPDPLTSLVEAVDAEVNEVVRLVLDHSLYRSDESLMVVTPSARNAARIQQALAGLLDKEFLAKHEPFVVVTLEQAVSYSRDRVIFSLGYGRTPRGRVVSEFGPLSEPGGSRLVAVAFTRARRFLDVVSCFHFDELEQERLQYGAAELMRVLADCQEHFTDPNDGGPMLRDLARRLELMGAKVRLHYRDQIALVAAYEGKALAVDLDNPPGSLRETLVSRPQNLESSGWLYLKVHSFELFADPAEVANRAGYLLGMIEPPLS